MLKITYSYALKSYKISSTVKFRRVFKIFTSRTSKLGKISRVTGVLVWDSIRLKPMGGKMIV